MLIEKCPIDIGKNTLQVLTIAITWILSLNCYFSVKLWKMNKSLNQLDKTIENAERANSLCKSSLMFKDSKSLARENKKNSTKYNATPVSPTELFAKGNKITKYTHFIRKIYSFLISFE